ncbi:hypothetical protein PMIN02_004137 [Paraphaeosphaeria minitans]
MITSLEEASLTRIESGWPGGHLSLGDVDKTGDTVASPNYGSRVDGHVVNLGDGGINIETSNNYSLEAGAVLNIHQGSSDERIEVASWLDDLAHLDFVPAHRANLAQRCDKVGTWVLEDERYQEWFDGNCRTLWIHGILGCGKTILASNIIEYLETRKDGSACLFVFFDYLQKDTQTPYNIAVNILKQLVKQQSNLSEPVRKMYTELKYLSTPPSIPELLNLVNQESKRFARARLIIDGLDECPANASGNARAEFLSMIRGLTPETNLLFTARAPYNEIHDLGAVVELRYSPTKEDFRCYLEAQLQRHCTFNELLAESNHKELVEVITSQARGMLLLSRLHINAIAAQHTSTGIQSALKSLPTDIKHTYEKAMERMSSGDRSLAERVLMWLTFAMRSMTTKELRSALAVNENVSNMHQSEGYMYSEKRILDVCEGLVVTDHQVEPCNVRLIHPTAQAHFEAYFDNQQAHKHLAIACLRYLQFEDVKIAIETPEEIHARTKELPFLRYAAVNWAQHARRTKDEELVRTCVMLLKDQVNLKSVVQAVELTNPDSVSACYLAAESGLLEAVNDLLSQDPHAIEEKMYGEIAIHAASREGHVAVMTKLLGHGSDADRPSDDGRTPVSLAAECGQLDAVRLLVGSYGVDSNSKSTTPFHRGCTPLSWASGNGHFSVVEYLLAQDNTQVDASISDGPFIGRTALMLAACNGHKKVVKLLLRKGEATASMVDGDGMSALAFASQQGYASIVELLIEADPASARRKDVVYNRRPVDWALNNGHETIVGSLLTYPALDWKDDEERTMLSYEAQYGNLELVRRLLAFGADRNTRDEEAWMPLAYAAQLGHTQIVKLLLQEGANVDALTVDQRSSLSFAAEHGRYETVNLLLKSGAKPDEPDRFNRTPLSYASGSGRVDVVEMLLNQNVDVNVKPRAALWTTQPPIMWASANGHHEVVKKLLETGKILLTAEDKLHGEVILSETTYGSKAILQSS